jgi:hypothetical protein
MFLLRGTTTCLVTAVRHANMHDKEKIVAGRNDRYLLSHTRSSFGISRSRPKKLLAATELERSRIPSHDHGPSVGVADISLTWR